MTPELKREALASMGEAPLPPMVIVEATPGTLPISMASWFMAALDRPREEASGNWTATMT